MGSPLTFVEERCAEGGGGVGYVCEDHPLLGGRKKAESKFPGSINSRVSGGAAVHFTYGYPYAAWGGMEVWHGDCPSVLLGCRKGQRPFPIFSPRGLNCSYPLTPPRRQQSF